MAKESITLTTVDTDNVQNQPDQPTISAAALKLVFDQYGIDNNDYLNTVLNTELNGDSGSKKIGHSSANVAADNVGDALQEVAAKIIKEKPTLEIVSVLDFGAVGDGVADDTVAINAALASFSGTGTLYFPAGVYVVSSEITLVPGVSIVGEDMFAANIAPVTTGMTVFSLNFSTVTGANLSIRNIAIQCNVTTGIKGLKFTNCTRVKLENMIFYGCETNFEFDRGGLHSILSCVSAGTATLKSGNIRMWSSDDSEYGCVFTSVVDYRIENNGQGVQSPAVFLRRCVGTKFTNFITNDSDDTGTCIRVENDCQGITFENGIVVGYAIGIEFLRGPGIDQPPVYCILSNFDFDQCSVNSVLITAGYNLLFSGGHYTSSQEYENTQTVSVASDVGQVRFEGVQITGYRDPFGTAIFLNGSGNVTIQDCLIAENFQGISYNNNPTNIIVRDNDFVLNTNNIVGNFQQVGNLIISNKGIDASEKVIEPTVPASGVGQTNNSGYVARVFIFGGTVTQIEIDSKVTGLTNGTFLLYTGEEIKLTYSVAPDWEWIAI